jgi:hypothetical protein
MYTGVLVGVTSVFGEPVVDAETTPGVAESGVPVFGTTEVDPQAITASMVTRQKAVIRAL